MSHPRVSVICIFFNEERFIGEAIESVLAQDFQDFELLLVDDGSKDGSSEIARVYASRQPQRILYLDHPDHANRGMSAARNLGLSFARGEFVVVMDADDRWYSNKVGEQVALLDAHPAVGMVCGGFSFWHSWAGGKDEEYYSGHVFDRPSFPPETTLSVYPLGLSNNPTDPMVRREIALRVGGYEEAFRGLYEDQVFLSKIYLETGVLFARRIWHDYRRHSTSCSLNASRSDYVECRTRFLDWFEDYLDRRPQYDNPRIRLACRRARRRLRFHGCYLLLARLRRVARWLAGTTGITRANPRHLPAS